MLEIQDEFDPPFEAVEPAQCRGPVLFNSPHSGRIYPRAFLLTSRLDLATLRRSEDSFVDDLIAGIAARGHPIMKAHFPRCYVDVNREPYELDPRMFDGRLPSFANTRSMRVAGGLGTVARVVGDAQEIYDQRIAVGEALRRSEDSFVDDLIAGIAARGHPIMKAHFPRCYVDVNREPYELDPRMFDGRLPSFANTRSMRVAGGLGTVARVVGDAQEIYDQRIAVAEALRRIDSLYKPYHRALRRLFMRLHRDFGAAMLIDCHSMPSTTGARDERPRADLVLGDRYGTSCVPIVAETIEATMRGFGYAVSRNKPYAGGFITEHYGNPTTGLHAIQLEINRALYMDERRYERSASFARLAGEFELLSDRLAEIPLEELRPYRAAAE
jgi:N-formylglutamate deformylase